ncbi:MBL fold metallo-hydrolase [Larkinella sp. VNQ87]|uniref:MBL fold metallo-hydrolase n=1 Tax=Larkinella sp. VNQ87 TaxID=3400921 RepID=UPI003C121B3F
MRRIVLLLLFLAYGQKLLAQADYGYTNLKKSTEILTKAIRYLGTESDTLNLLITASGLAHETGHFAKPDLRMDMKETDRIRLYKGSTVFYVENDLNYKGKDYQRQLFYNALTDSLYAKDYFSRGRVYRGPLTDRHTPFLEAATAHPAVLLQMARKNRASLRFIGKEGAVDVMTVSLNGVSMALFIQPSGELSKASYLDHDNVYGDNVHQFNYQDYQKTASYRFPTRFEEYEFGGLRKELTYAYDWQPSYQLPTNQVCPACQVPRPADPLRSFAVKFIGKNLYAIDLTDFNNRVLVLQTGKSLVVFEAPISYEVGKNVVQLLRKQFPGKPVSHVFVTHHHPDHAGAIRAFAEEGATILTSSGNKAFFEKMVGYPHLLAGSGEPFNKPKQTLRFELIDNQRVFTIGDGSFSVFFTDKTQHTDEYLMAYFPAEKVLFQGDLCFFEPGEESPASVREMAVYQLIKEHNLAVDKIYSSWPIHGYKEFGTWSDLMRKVALAEKSK